MNKINRDELFRRTRAALNPDIAREEVFAVLGLGSGGARVAEEMARFGVGRLILVDLPGERLEESNVIRHPLGYSSIGRLKTEAMAERLLDINPACDVQAEELDIVLEPVRLLALLLNATQILLCTDNEESKHVANRVALAVRVPMVFAGVFDGGCGGEAGRAMPGQACYACIAAALNRSAISPMPEKTFDYSTPGQDEFRGTAALNIDIAQIALIQARMALLTMLAKADPSQEIGANYILFGNRPVPGLFPRMLHSQMQTIPRNPACMVCGDAGLSEEEATREAAEIEASANCTTPPEGGNP
ncbi:MAG: ThiF family adenylyltransferase [Planctomycetota bacterium]